VGALHDAGELAQLLVIPCNEQRARALHGNADPPGVVGQQLEPACHQPRLQRAGLGVEAGVEQRGVRLARARPHVGSGLEQGHTKVEAGQLPRERATHHARADDGHVRVERLVHGPQYRPSAVTSGESAENSQVVPSDGAYLLG
jgi:hypothetical protein